MNLPNALTLLRLLMVPLVPLCFFVWDKPVGAFFVYIIASTTDFLDGYLARRLNLVTDMGKVLDPLADKLLQVTSLICLTIVGWVPLFITLFVAIKEGIMIIGGTVLLKTDRLVIPAKMAGKVATILFIAGTTLSFLAQWVHPVHLVILIAAILVSIVAFIQYALIAAKNLKERGRLF